MKTAMLFVGILFPLFYSVAVIHFMVGGDPMLLSSASVVGMLLIFFSHRYEAAAVFYLAVAMSNLKAVMLPMYIPIESSGFFCHFLVAMYISLYLFHSRKRKLPYGAGSP